MGVERANAVCRKCQKKIRGARYTKPYHFVPSRAQSNPLYDLCFMCWGSLSDSDLELDPYWILVPSLFPNDDFEVQLVTVRELFPKQSLTFPSPKFSFSSWSLLSEHFRKANSSKRTLRNY